MGGIPVDRSKPGGIIQDALNQIKDLEGALIAMSPEGTRSKVKEWKTGFLRIAKELNTKIIPASIDFAKKEILLGNPFTPSGNNPQDIINLKKYYSIFTPKYPEKY
jgi:1-acyl-sn-glycerol-3-phosphate acyltransferase